MPKPLADQVDELRREVERLRTVVDRQRQTNAIFDQRRHLIAFGYPKSWATCRVCGWPIVRRGLCYDCSQWWRAPVRLKAALWRSVVAPRIARVKAGDIPRYNPADHEHWWRQDVPNVWRPQRQAFVAMRSP